MSDDRTTRRPASARNKAEAIFKAPALAAPAPVADRINDVLRQALPASVDEGLRPDELNPSNDV